MAPTAPASMKTRRPSSQLALAQVAMSVLVHTVTRCARSAASLRASWKSTMKPRALPDRFDASTKLFSAGTARPSTMPTIAIAVISSSRVKPRCLLALVMAEDSFTAAPLYCDGVGECPRTPTGCSRL